MFDPYAFQVTLDAPEDRLEVRLVDVSGADQVFDVIRRAGSGGEIAGEQFQQRLVERALALDRYHAGGVSAEIGETPWS